jgi:hypothetical protein
MQNDQGGIYFLHIVVRFLLEIRTNYYEEPFFEKAASLDLFVGYYGFVRKPQLKTRQL